MSELTPDHFGKHTPDGAVEHEPRFYIGTRQLHQPGTPSVRERVPGTALFYRLTPSQAGAATDEQREEWRAAAVGLQPEPAVAHPRRPTFGSAPQGDHFLSQDDQENED